MKKKFETILSKLGNASVRSLRQEVERQGWQIQDLAIRLQEAREQRTDLMTSLLHSRWQTDPDAITSRREFGYWLNWNGLLGKGVEVGVHQGKFSSHLLSTWKGERLYSVDPWLEFSSDDYVDRCNVPQGSQEENYTMTRELLEPHRERSELVRKLSIEAAGDFTSHELDFVYLDAQHHYEAVVEDLNAWHSKVKPGGVIGGHDFIDGMVDASLYGVQRAVLEFFSSPGKDVIVTREDRFRSWFVRM